MMGGGTRFGTATMVVASLIAIAGLVFAASAAAVSPNPNPWLQNRFLIMAHQGGEDEAPSNTMFALKSALRDRGADSLELDINMSKDGQLMVIHDDTWSRIACTHVLCPGPNSGTEQQRPAFTQVRNMTVGGAPGPGRRLLVQAGNLFARLLPARFGLPRPVMRTGDVPPPPVATARPDFEIPTLRQVLNAFPNTSINIEIKMIKTLNNDTTTGSGCTGSPPNRYCDDPDASIPVADKLAPVCSTKNPSTRAATILIVVSFSDELLAEFHRLDGPAVRGPAGRDQRHHDLRPQRRHP